MDSSERDLMMVKETGPEEGGKRRCALDRKSQGPAEDELP